MAYEEIEDTTFQKAETGTMFLELVKRDLQITWTDKETEKILIDYIEDGMEVLQNDVGTSINFSDDKLAKGLLRTYVRYAWNKCEEYFISNNLERILKLEVKYGKD